MRIVHLFAVYSSAVISFPFVDAFSFLRFLYDGCKELEGPLDLGIIDRDSSVQKVAVQMNDAFANFQVGYR